jgi:hypothetical protein
MGKKAVFRPSLVTACSFLTLSLAAATSGTQAAEMRWIWSSSSALVNQSTEALAEGRFPHAIRFANAALRSKTHPANHAIARHNLCIATLARDADKAARPCAAALDAKTAYVIAEREGRLQVIDSAEANGTVTSALDTIMRDNIARAQGGSALAQNR